MEWDIWLIGRLWRPGGGEMEVTVRREWKKEKRLKKEHSAPVGAEVPKINSWRVWGRRKGEPRSNLVSIEQQSGRRPHCRPRDKGPSSDFTPAGPHLTNSLSSNSQSRGKFGANLWPLQIPKGTTALPFFSLPFCAEQARLKDNIQAPFTEGSTEIYFFY